MAKTWIITGASRGLGSLVAKRALERGDNVLAMARNPDAIGKALGIASLPDCVSRGDAQ